MPIHCVFALRDESGLYCRNTYVTLLSLLEHTRSDLVIHIIHDETIEHGRRDLAELCARYGQKLEFHPIPPLPQDAVQAACKAFHFSALYHLFIHELVDADRAIYLDSDLVFQCDIAELDAVELDGRIAAAALDEGGYWKKGAKVKKKSAALVAKAGFDPATYFNSGVIIYDLQKMRAICPTAEVFWNICREYSGPGLSLNADQDIVNIFCAAQGGVKYLEARFNYLLYARGRMYESAESFKGKILHFANPLTKPEAVLFPAQLLFWKYYAQAPWGGDVFERMDKVFFQPRMRFLRDYVLHPRRRQALADYASGGICAIIKNRFCKKR